MFNISNYKALIEELKCKQCSKILSVLPVYYCAAIGSVCGRCVGTVDWMISNGTLERCISYEAIAKFLIFPCYNQKNGCDVNLKCTEVVAHEMLCKAQLVQCVFQMELGQTKCPWKGPSKNFTQHLHTTHKEKQQVGLPTSFINIQVTHINQFFTVIENHTFLLITKYDKDVNKFFYLVVCCESYPINQCYRYQLELGRCNDYFFILRKPEPESMGNIQEMLDNEKAISVDVAAILNMLNDPNGIIHYKLSILKKTKKEITTIMGTVPKVTTRSKSKSKNKSKPGASNKNVQTPVKVVNTQKTEADLAKLKLGETSGQTKGRTFGELECPICNEYMFTPIFICPTGHSICNICTTKLQHCPLCRQSMQNTRNFTLEKLAETLKFPCCYKEQGCNVNLLLQHLKIHELHCTFAYGRCPLKSIISCPDNNIIDIIGHLRQKHPTYIVETNHQYSRDVAGKITTSYWVTIHENQIFIICCKHSSKTGPIKFNVLHAGTNKNQSKYKYEIHFCDQTGKRLKLIISEVCDLFAFNPSTALNKCLMIPIELLQPYINKAKVPRLFFKFFIEKL